MRSFFLLRSKLRSLRFLSMTTKISILFLVIAGSFGVSAVVQAQTTYTGPRAPRQQGIGAQDRGVGDFVSGVWGSMTAALTDRAETANESAASGAINDIATDPTGTISTELTDVARAAGVTGTGSITDILTARIVGLLAFLMGLVVSFLGKIILLLVNILLGFLSYNDFANAPPVVIGWKMVRDLANMFFIVVLIVSSYATILGWKTNELHVKNVLPKVLLAAVLVNFSKTIVSLLIDASQIAMLTFVNSFASIGAGNFTNALHLPLIADASYANQLQASVSSTAQSVAASGAGTVILDVVLASALQIFLLVIAIGIMLMMVIFVVVRIVGLWMLLIFSPMPFLADALPGPLKNMLGPQIKNFWPRLSGLLTGGPVMAFWLWLTFATLSAQGADERLGLFQNTQAANVSGAFNIAQSGASMFITAIGNARGLGSYIVAVAMMMMALEAAMGVADDVSKSISSEAGGLMKKIGNKSREYATSAAKFVGYGAAAGAAGSAVTAVDRRYDVRGKLAGTARRLPIARNNEWLRKQQYANREEELKRASEESKILNNPLATQAEKDREISRLRAKYAIGGDPAVKRALAQDALKTAGNEKAFDTQLKPAKDSLKDKVKGSTNDDVVAKRVSDRYGKQEAAEKRISEYERAKAMITDSSKESVDKRREIDDAIKKIRKDNPHLIRDEKERAKQMSEVKQNFNSLDEDARGNFEVLKNFAAPGAFKEGADGKITVGDAAAIRATRKKLQGQNRDNFDAMVNYVKESKDGVKVSELRNLSAEKDANDRTRIFEAQTNGDGQITGGGFKLSYQREQAVETVKKGYSDANSGTWKTTPMDAYGHSTPMVEGTQADDLVRAAKTVGVSQVVQNVGAGAKGAAADEQRQAAVNGLAARTSSGLSEATRYMKEVDPTTGKSRTDTLRDNKAPEAVKERIRTEYQSKVNEVLPMLDGVGELPEDQQIDFMAAMGQSNVGIALNSGNMSDPDMKASVQKVKMMVNENAEAVRGYFADEDQAKMDDFANFRQQDEYFKSQPKAVLDEYDDLQKKSAADRDAILNKDAAKQAGYNEYVQNRTLETQVAAKGIIHDIKAAPDEYAKYRKYDDARKAINQFNATGGKGSASSNRNRGGGRRGRGTP